jgi:predicted N-formylglutamate amidohydrolase
MADGEDGHEAEVTLIMAAPSSVLVGPDDPHPVGAHNPGAPSPFLIVCDHAGVAVPRGLGRLGLADAAFSEHIASDLGVAALAERLGARLGATVITQSYSRLVIDCNRAPGHPASILAVSDGWPIPGNANLGEAEVRARVAEIFAPYHASIAAELDARAGRPTALICLHSFTPILGGEARPWDMGVLHLGDSALCEALLEALRAEGDLEVGDNQPYAMDGTDFTAPHHAAGRNIDYAELEIRQDLIADNAGLDRFTELLARVLPAALPPLHGEGQTAQPSGWGGAGPLGRS